MADKRISQLIERVDIANNDVLPIVASGATTTNKVTISTLQDWMQDNLDVGVTSVGITIGSTGTDVNVTGSPVTSSGNITINLPTASATNRGLLSAADWVTFNSKQDAGSFVTLDTTQTITAQKTFTTSGSSDTMIISHGSGSGFALDVLKAGNGEAIRVTKSSGTGNAMTISGGNFEAGTIVKTGGISSQFLKADGSVDSSSYLTTGSAGSTYVPYSGAAASVNLGVYSITANAINSAGSGSTAGQINLRSDAFFSLVNGYGSIASGTTNQFNLYQTTGAGVFRGAILSLNSITASATRTYTLPDADGTLALSTDLGAYLPLAGGTLTGALNGTSAVFSGNVGIGTSSSASERLHLANSTNGFVGLRLEGTGTYAGSDWTIYASSVSPSSADDFLGFFNNSATDGATADYKFRLFKTGAATFSSSVQGNSFIHYVNSSYNATSSIYGIAYNFGASETADGVTYSIAGGSASTTGNSFTWKTQTGGLTPSTALTINKSGNVGIGTDSPVAISSFTTLDIRGATGGGIRIGKTSFSSLNIQQDGVDAYLNNVADGHMFFLTNDAYRVMITNGGILRPYYDNTNTLGASGARWSAVWAANGTIQTSDEREKKDIIDSDLGLDFVNQLRPVSFKWKVGQNVVTREVVKDEEGNPILDEEGNEKTESIITPREGIRTHYGLIAQEVEELLDGKDFGGFIHDEETDIKGLRYDQFVPLLIKAIQELKTEIDSLKNQMQ